MLPRETTSNIFLRCETATSATRLQQIFATSELGTHGAAVVSSSCDAIHAIWYVLRVSFVRALSSPYMHSKLATCCCICFGAPQWRLSAPHQRHIAHMLNWERLQLCNGRLPHLARLCAAWSSALWHTRAESRELCGSSGLECGPRQLSYVVAPARPEIDYYILKPSSSTNSTAETDPRARGRDRWPRRLIRSCCLPAPALQPSSFPHLPAPPQAQSLFSPTATSRRSLATTTSRRLPLAHAS